LNPNHYDVRFNLGTAYAHQKQNDAAREQLEKAVTLDPSKAEAHFHLAQVLRALGQTTDAQTQLKLFEQCQQATTTLALGQTKAGQAAQALDAGNITQAISLYREAIDALPQDAVLEYDLALALERASDAAGERAALEKALQLRPGFAEAENQLGLVTARAGEISAAEQHFRNAIAAAPSYAAADNNLGTLLGQQGKDREAETFLRSAVSANPRFGQAWVNLAATLASESRFTEARAAVESALRIDPRNADALRLREMLAGAAGGEPSASSPSSASARKPH
jgi:tetratricopeptide (TPR) repeat protein